MGHPTPLVTPRKDLLWNGGQWWHSLNKALEHEHRFFFPIFLTETWAQLPVADQEVGPRPNRIIEKGVKISLMSGVV